MAAVRIPAGRALAWRLHRHGLAAPGEEPAGAGPADGDVVATVRALGGVQAQVPAAAALALSVRLDRDCTADVDRALNTERRLVRLWSVRGTLHLQAPDVAARLCAVLGSLRYWEKPYWSRGHGVTPEDVATIVAAVGTVLPGEVLSRPELVAAIVEETGSAHLGDALGSGWGALLKPAAMLGLICHGPADGTRVTFTSPATWLSGWDRPDPEEAGRDAVRAYLRAYAPCTREDFAAWLARGAAPKARVNAWFGALADELTDVEVDGRAGVVLTEDLDELRATAPGREVRLLPAFDQYVVAVNRDLVPAAHRKAVSRTAGWISPVVLRGGRVAGVWDLDDGVLTVRTFERVPVTPLRREAARIGRLTGAGTPELSVCEA